VSINPDGHDQRLNVTFQAADDTDISYVSVQATGLRVSDLRAAGGVITRARRKAFADTSGSVRIYPERDDQNTFEYSLKIDSPLSVEEMLHNALVLVEVQAVDASGNQSSFSEVVIVGEDTEEQVFGMEVAPSRIIFTNAMEVVQLITSIEFQFRGWVPLPGAGHGIGFSSSDPSLVHVSGDGRVYPLAETGASPVFVSVSFPGLETMQVPVEVSFTKELTGLRLDGYAPGQTVVLDSLNRFYPLPTVLGVFNDGT
jgi:hypothetical protein